MPASVVTRGDIEDDGYEAPDVLGSDSLGVEVDDGGGFMELHGVIEWTAGDVGLGFVVILRGGSVVVRSLRVGEGGGGSLARRSGVGAGVADASSGGITLSYRGGRLLFGLEDARQGLLALNQALGARARGGVGALLLGGGGGCRG